MTQTIPATAVLGPGKTGLTIGYRVLNLDGTEYSAFSTTGVAETSTAGTYRVAGGVVAPLAGGYIVWGEAATDYAEATVESASANVTMQAGVAVAAADGNGYIPANVLNWRSVQPAALDSGGNVLTSVNDVQEAAQQQIRDAAKLAPTAGAPAAGSIDAHLDDILEDTGTTLPSLLSSTVAGSNDVTTAGSITRRRGNSWSISLTLGAITGYTSLWFTAKLNVEDADTAAIVQIKKNASGSGDGLLYVNGTSPSSAALGSITVSDATTGAIIVALDETITDDLTPDAYYYDCQVLISGNVTTPETGTLTVTADVTRSVA